ncbi:MAG TPA: hypothetical protein VMH91_01580 [Candidatus Paceibacterota bacterium]|nr:hypothetical protein [Candidatus Paceibacterota bacterium]
MVKRKENNFDTLARLIKEEGEDIRIELGGKIDGVDKGLSALEKKMDEGFTAVNRRLDTIIQVQLDEHGHRLKKLETAVFSGK